jgi:precorrin-3B C17-methyltransferase
VRGLTAEAVAAISAAEVVVGYKKYVQLVEPLLAGKQVISSGMKKEMARAEAALEMAAAGKHVAVISSGDPGVYGMAGPILQLASADIPVQVIPGVTAANAAAAVLGAPLMNDYAVISLSDLLTPWETIVRRLEGAAAADFIVVLYNPRSHGRPEHLEQARRILLSFKPPGTLLGLVKNCGRAGQVSKISTLAEFDVGDVDMFTTVIIGNSQTKELHGRMVTMRGYRP